MEELTTKQVSRIYVDQAFLNAQKKKKFDISAIFKSLKNMLAVKLLAVFFLTMGLGTLLVFITNYFIVKNNIEKIITSDLMTTITIIYDAIDLHFSDDKYRKEFKKNLESGSPEIDFDARFNELKYRIRKVKIGENGYAYMINSKGDIMIHH